MLSIIFFQYNRFMFKNNINGDFSEEFKTTKTFVKNIEKELLLKSRTAKIMWVVFSVLIALTNIASLVVASFALKIVMDDYHMAGSKVSLQQILPTALVSVLSIVIFLLSIAITIHQGLMKTKIYQEANEDIQFITIAYTTEKIKMTEEAFKNKIDKIYRHAVKKRAGISLKKTLITVLTGADNE